MKNSGLQKGFTLTEILVVIAIMMVLIVLTIQSFNTLAASKSLDTTTQQVVIELQKARSLTLASQVETQYGVHFASSTITLFDGATYIPGASSSTISYLSPTVVISALALTGGATDVIFDRLTGKTSEYGTITVTVSGKLSSSKTIRVYSTGVTEIQ